MRIYNIIAIVALFIVFGGLAALVTLLTFSTRNKKDKHVTVRIVQRVRDGGADGSTVYVIQRRHSLFRWLWVDVRIKHGIGALTQAAFFTLAEAKANLWRFDKKRRSPTEKVVYEQ